LVHYQSPPALALPVTRSDGPGIDGQHSDEPSGRPRINFQNNDGSTHGPRIDGQNTHEQSDRPRVNGKNSDGPIIDG
jgi:hypothetical protein